MPTKSHVHVRQMEVGDFEFVRELAAKQPGFTVPPPYVLWLILRVKDAICLVAENSSDGLMAYLLAVPVQDPLKTLHVWQLASAEASNSGNAPLALVRKLRSIARRLGIRRVTFSSVPNSPSFRAARRLTSKVFSATVKQGSVLPTSVGDKECQYQFELRWRQPKTR